MRYDSYSDFGSTTNPNVGLMIRPVEGLRIFGHRNTSFNAPTTLDVLPLSLGRQGSVLYCAASYCNKPDPNAAAGTLGRWNGLGTKGLVLEGPGFGIMPQTAENWAIGFEANPLRGLRFGGEFYLINFKNAIGSVNTQNNQSFIDFTDNFVLNYTATDASGQTFAQRYAALVGLLANSGFVSNNIGVNDVALIVDRRTSNLFNEKLRGVDFHIYFDTDVSFGHLALSFSGTKTLKAERRTGQVISDDQGLNGPDFNFTSFVGLSTKHVNARLTVNYSGRFRDGVGDYLGNTAYVDPFVSTNLFLGYDFGETAGALSGTSLRFSVDNVFDAKPTYILRSPSSSGLSYGGWTLGRVLRFGISKEF